MACQRRAAPVTATPNTSISSVAGLGAVGGWTTRPGVAAIDGDKNVSCFCALAQAVVWVCGREYDLLFPFCSTLFTARTPVLSQDTPEERLPKGCVAVRCGVRQRPAYHGLGHGEWSTAWGAIGHTQKHKHKHSASIRIDQSSKRRACRSSCSSSSNWHQQPQSRVDPGHIIRWSNLTAVKTLVCSTSSRRRNAESSRADRPQTADRRPWTAEETKDPSTLEQWLINGDRAR